MTTHPEHPDGGRDGASRRAFLAGSSLALLAGTVGGTVAAQSAFAAPVSPHGGLAGRAADGTARALASAHPGMQHTAAQLSAAADHVAAGAQPWTAGWDRLVANGRSAATWQPRPLADVIRGGDGQNYAQMFPDIHTAYQNALRWHVSGDEAHGAAAARILNAWSATMRSLGGNADRFLAAGIYGYQWANAAELVRDRSDFDRGRFADLLLGIFHPMNEQFLTHHNDAVITNYWANWDLCNMASVLAIGILADRQDLVGRAVDYFEGGAGNGSIGHAVPFLYSDDGGLGQWQESGRDQAHTIMGIGLMGAFCEMAWNQGIDCYGYDDNRFLKGAQYVAKYNLGHAVPFTEYTWQSGPVTSPRWNTQTVISAASRGQARPVWAMVLAHYSGRKGLEAGWVRQIAETVRPEGGGGDYGTTSGGYDQLGFGTLMY
ncbi:Alginate lyase [Promicromonospora umidemergens]|uniref:Alginate lyase family protein n=1 Tax=Promicromonospora umidemergens TaxID=629679 RepID=A0ABP8WL77_9MICO|nr:alginate lyase family protein [Promicromonospora umidemergens]MCP2283842.1 Alginate lyase [Promicromonospora umidemergens]